jgi:excisionase family DNA binding protein
LTVAEAAERLGVSKEAVRKRIHRGTLDSDKDPDGTVRVYVPPSTTPSSTGRDELVDELRDRLHYVEGQLEAERQSHSEARRLLAAALERIPPQLEAPTERPGSPETATEEVEPHPGGGQEGAQRPWWRRVFGG